eukprot:Gb_14648 [translate_table: standard]
MKSLLQPQQLWPQFGPLSFLSPATQEAKQMAMHIKVDIHLA